jgi:hypothetical protein
MSSLVVTGGATYEGVETANVDSLIVETDNDPELNPEINSLISRSSVLGYRPEDRNDLLRSVKFESTKKPLMSNGDDGVVIPRKNKAQINDDDLVVTTTKNTEGGTMKHIDIGDVDWEFDGGDLLFKFEGGGEEFDDGFEGCSVCEYFDW